LDRNEAFDDGELTSHSALRRIATLAPFAGLSTRSGSMHDVFAALGRLAPRDVSVLLLGETGVGKEVLAKAVHRQSARARRPFVIFDCGAVAPNLAESELLGHERGSFTGALGTHVGAFERAHGGTLFLDEVGELPLELQPRLLRALDSRRVRRVGGRDERVVDVRVVAATNRDLRAEVRAGAFREDLYFRLAVAVVRVPALRERRDDVPDLCRALLVQMGREDVAISDDALLRLRDHDWPGNVRELKNALACAVALLDGGMFLLEVAHINRVIESRSCLSWPPPPAASTG
jgi:DNA-binding NtrC family response regulator